MPRGDDPGSGDAARSADARLDPTVEDHLARLATFPEQNPNLVIETELDGKVTYLNPVAAARFPDLYETGVAHPLLAGLDRIVEGFLRGEHHHVAREVDTGPAVFEQKVCYTQTGDQAFLRIYAHDITDLRRAEQAVHELARRVVHAQEAERHRVSRELHDEAGQALAALKISLQLLQSETALEPEMVRSNLAEAVSLVDDTRERIRLLAHGLRPPTLDAIGLDATLEDFCAEFARRTQIEAEYRGEVISGLTDDVQTCLYRFLQEALTNAAVHAQAAHVRITLQRANGHVRLSVADDGEGMDPDVLEQPGRTGFGLAGMRERVELLSGELTIESAPGGGTLLIATLPIEPGP